MFLPPCLWSDSLGVDIFFNKIIQNTRSGVRQASDRWVEYVLGKASVCVAGGRVEACDGRCVLWVPGVGGRPERH